MEISYETDIASYTHYIPAADETGQQDSTVFAPQKSMQTSEATE
mgnify:CR=1 FL=1